MLRKTTKKNQKIKKSSPQKVASFFDLPQKKQKEIVLQAAILSNKDQEKLLKKYKREFGELQTNSCK
jgi:hypothetical protein